MSENKYTSPAYKHYLAKRGIDWDDFRQECALVQLEHPDWDDNRIGKQALRQSVRAISGNRRNRVDQYALEDKRESLPAVAERHRELAIFWDKLPNLCKEPIANAMENPTESIPNWCKRLATITLERCCVVEGMFKPDSVWSMFLNEINRTRTPVRHRTKFMTRSEVKQSLASYASLTSRDYYDSITHQRKHK